MRAAFLVFGCAAATALTPPLLAQDGADATLGALLDRAARYTQVFVRNFSNVVAEERYVQDSSASQGPRRRTVTSDFLLVKVSDAADYLPFRDVFEVDGIQVRDREQRLEKLFLTPSTNTIQQAAAIASESARYNLGAERLRRTINNPLLAFSFLQPDIQKRFRFTLDRADREAGSGVWIVRFAEQTRPSIVRGAFDYDILARGRVWIDLATGRVIRTELALADGSVTATITTSFRFDERFDIAVPAAMADRYVMGRISLGGEATYGRFRRFGVTTDETIQAPPGR
jgi:hypothetical protein